MPDVLEQAHVPAPSPRQSELPGPVTETAHRSARNDLRTQIAGLERQLAELFASAFPRQGMEWGIGSTGGPRVLSIGDLERVRDALAVRLRDTRAELAARADVEEANRGLLERMIAEPQRHRWLLVSNEDVGERGCRHWHSRPRWGILGMLFGWWRIRLSSGCPLAEGPRPPATSARRTRRLNSGAPPLRPSGSAIGLMAKKRRKRRPRAAATTASPPAPAPTKAPRRPIEEERPPAPWGTFPLVELVVLVALGMLIAGLIASGPRGTALLVTGLALGSLAGLELSIREHFAGYRSHTVLLAGVAGVVTLGLLFYAVPDLLPPVGRVAAGIAVAVAAGVALTRAFRARSGRAFKLR